MAIRILHLEDDPHDTELAQRELVKMGLDVTVERTEDAVQFERVLREAPPDLVISDHNLPAVLGRRALEILRSVRPETPFVLLTGSLSEEAAVDYMKAGAADYILKDRMVRLGPAVVEALDRARERRELRTYEGLLRQIADANPNLIFVRRADGRLVLVNRAMAEIYGTTVENVLGKTDAELHSKPEELAGILESDREVLESGRPKLIAEQGITDAMTGQLRWFQIIKVPLRLPDDPEPKVLGVATDITERKRLEDQLRQAQKIEAVGQLAGGVAHDFNNILTTIMGHAELALDAPEVSAETRSDLEEIRSAAEHAASLTRQLLAFSRKQILQPQVLDLNAMVVDLQKMLRRLLMENLVLKFELAADLGSIRADPTQVGQVLINLAVNARDAMPEGGQLTVQTENAELDEEYATSHIGVQPGRYVVLTVSDTGVGMDDQTKARLFEPFFTTKGPGKGTGLGLSTVYGIVKQSGGWIWVYSELGHGSTFRIYFPRVDAAPTAPRRPVREESSSEGGTETILLVEDSAPVRSLAVSVLTSVGYRVIDAPDGVEAEKIAANHPGPIHLVLTDVIMPGMSGPDLARRLLKARPEIKVLFTSGYVHDAIISQKVVEGDVAFLQKPFSIDVLLRRVRQTLDGVTA
jgi:PAS domain S-box-containing protein